MRKLLMLSVCMAIVISLAAMNQKEAQIPTAAKTGFAAKFPAAQKVKWSIEKPGEFEAEFKLNKVETSAVFDAKGNLIETETRIKESELPQAVKATIAKDFAGYIIDEIEKATNAKGAATYEMEAIKGKDELEISIDASGKLLAKNPLKEDNEDKEKK